MPDRNWKEYNEALVRRGEILLDMDFIDTWPDELAKMNDGKVGKPFDYPESLIKLLAIVHAYLLPYRQSEGFTRVLMRHTSLKTPDFTSIAWRVAKMDVSIDDKIDSDDDDIVIAADSSGIKVANRGEWIRKKWNVRRGFIKMHIAVDKETKEIVAMKVTKEHVHDGRKLIPLVKQVMKKNVNVSKVIADGAYDSRNNFRFLADNNIESVIKVRKNASLHARGCMPRKLSVIEQKEDLDAWKHKHGYGYRWMAESAFSAFKRMFGEHVKAVRWKNMVKELLLKASIYNMFISMNPKGFG